MSNKLLSIALRILMNNIKGADGHVIAREISKKLTPTELEVLSGTVKEAEVRCKQARGYY